jgi:hypothetical protein
MTDHEIPDADIWVSGSPPVAAKPDDFWFDTSEVPLFGISIGGTLGTLGPPPNTGADGDAWWDADGNLWVQRNGNWVNQGNFRGPAGPAGPEGPTGPAGPAGTVNIKGTFSFPSQLPLKPHDHDAYVIGTRLYIWDGEEDSWTTVPFVGETGPTGPPGPPLQIVGTLPDTAPPRTSVGEKHENGETWIATDGTMWIWNGKQWAAANLGGSIPADGNPGDILTIDPTGAFIWVSPRTVAPYADLEARIAALEALAPELSEWIGTADWSLDKTRKLEGA